VPASSPTPVSGDRPSIAVHSTLLGPLSVTPASIFELGGGLRGFETLTAFALVPAVRQGLFWLQSTELPECTFLLADPFAAAADYAIDLSDTDRAQLGLTDPASALVLAVITLPAGTDAPFDRPTINLRAPVVFNTQRGVARQIVSASEEFEFRAPVTIDAYPKRDDGGIAPAAR
jgi:flagellar assembly factor FliW